MIPQLMISKNISIFSLSACFQAPKNTDGYDTDWLTRNVKLNDVSGTWKRKTSLIITS